MLNPYASQLGELDPVEVIAATPAKLHALMDAIGANVPNSRVRRASGARGRLSAIWLIARWHSLSGCARRWPKIAT